jgi:hypothetical protein
MPKNEKNLEKDSQQIHGPISAGATKPPAKIVVPV